MSGLAQNGTAEPVSRDQTLRREREQRKNNVPVQLTTSRIGNNTRLIHTLLKALTMHMNTYYMFHHTVIVNPSYKLYI